MPRLKTVEDKEHEYLAQIAAQGAYNLPQRPVRKNPEKYTPLNTVTSQNRTRFIHLISTVFLATFTCTHAIS